MGFIVVNTRGVFFLVRSAPPQAPEAPAARGMKRMAANKAGARRSHRAASLAQGELRHTTDEGPSALKQGTQAAREQPLASVQGQGFR